MTRLLCWAFHFFRLPVIDGRRSFYRCLHCGTDWRRDR